MPKTAAQWTGFAVTVIVVLGRDADVLTAIPLGVAAGIMATLFQAAMRFQFSPVRTLRGSRAPRLPAATTAPVPGSIELRRSVTSMVDAVRAYRPKRRHIEPGPLV